MQPITEYIYDGLFHPIKLYTTLSHEEDPPIVDSFFLVLLINVIIATLIFVPRDIGILNIGSDATTWLTLLNNLFGFILSIILTIFVGLLAWFAIGVFLGMLASIFKHTANIKLFLTLSGFSGIPVLFLPIVNMFKIIDNPFSLLIGVLLNFSCWVWCGILFLIAITKTYKMNITHLTLLIISPVATSVVLGICFCYFLMNLFVMF